MKVRWPWWVIVALVAGSAAHAQQQPPPAGARTIVGVVFDTLGNFVDSADVSISSIKKRTTSGADGSFKFDDITPGTYDVSARRFGYAAQARRVVVGANGGVVKFSLVPIPHALAPVISSVARGGLSGVIGDTAFNIVEGAAISVVASDHRTVSDSAGKFYLALNPGTYMVRVTRAGFITRMVSVRVPPDSGRRIVVWLVPGTAAANAVEEWALQGLRDRLVYRKSTSTIYTREDINRMGATELSQLATVGSGQRVDDGCTATIDGGPRTLPVWDIQAADIESVEIYPPGTLPLNGASALRSRPTTSINGNRKIAAQTSGNADCPVQIFVWLRK